MSFTRNVKEEVLTQHQYSKEELAAIIKLSGSLGLTSSGLTLSITTGNAKIARHIYALVATFYGKASEMKYHQKTNLKKNRLYTLFIKDEVRELLSDLRLADSFFGFTKGIEPTILADDIAGQAYLRGAFLATGTLSSPESGHYQLEIFSVYQDHAEDLAALLTKFLLSPKLISHKNGYVTYLQKAEDILDFLLIIGATKAKAIYESTKVFRETRNDLNRANNAETANITKTVTASMKSIASISKIKETIGLESLPFELQQIAQLRLAYPELSLQELADRLESPLSKSGVNHRLRRINQLADNL